MQASSTVTPAIVPLCGCLSKPQHSRISRARLCATSEGTSGQRMRPLGIPAVLSNRRGVYAAGLAAGVLLLSRAMLPLGRPRASSNSSLVDLLRGELHLQYPALHADCLTNKVRMSVPSHKCLTADVLGAKQTLGTSRTRGPWRP